MARQLLVTDTFDPTEQLDDFSRGWIAAMRHAGERIDAGRLYTWDALDWCGGEAG